MVAHGTLTGMDSDIYLPSGGVHLRSIRMIRCAKVGPKFLKSIFFLETSAYVDIRLLHTIMHRDIRLCWRNTL